MLRRGYILQQADTNHTIPELKPCTFESMAARNGVKISPETFKQMKIDRQKAEEDSENNKGE